MPGDRIDLVEPCMVGGSVGRSDWVVPAKVWPRNVVDRLHPVSTNKPPPPPLSTQRVHGCCVNTNFVNFAVELMGYLAVYALRITYRGENLMVVNIRAYSTRGYALRIADRGENLMVARK